MKHTLTERSSIRAKKSQVRSISQKVICQEALKAQIQVCFLYEVIFLEKVRIKDVQAIYIVDNNVLRLFESALVTCYININVTCQIIKNINVEASVLDKVPDYDALVSLLQEDTVFIGQDEIAY